jgi:ABC-2 type transport system permease protein
MSPTRKLTQASLKMFVRNRQALFFSFFTPLIIMFIFGFIGFDRLQTIDIGIVSTDRTPETQAFINQIKTITAFTVHEGTLSDERAQLDQGNRSLVLVIPGDILPPHHLGAAGVLPGSGGTAVGPATITAYTNAGQAAQAQAGLSILQQIIDQATFAAEGVSPIVSINQQAINVHNLRYIDFLLPGLVALSIMQMSVFSVAFVFTQFKEKGVLKRLLATPMRPYQFVIANGITRLIVALIQAGIFIGLGLILFHAQIVGSPLLLLLIIVLGAIMFLGLGFTVSGLSKTVDSVPAIANLIVFPMLFLGGVFFPITSMPNWLQNIARVLPLTYFSNGLRDVMTKGSTILETGWNIVGLLVWAIVFLILATYAFSFQEKETA